MPSLSYKIRQAERLDNRRTPGLSGEGPTYDNDDCHTVDDSYHDVGAFNYTEHNGMWRESEDLKCRAGKPMRPLDERKFFGGPTWIRAREAQK